MHAAGRWIKYDNNLNLVPPDGQWGLWSMVICGQRHYFSGVTFQHEGSTHILFEGFRSLEIDDTLYYALVSHIPETSPPNPGDVVNTDR